MKSSAAITRRALFASAIGMAVARPATGRTRSVSRGGHDHGGFQDESLQSQDALDSAAAKLSKPWLAGQPRARVRDADNDPFIIDIENRVKCNCGCAHSLYACRTTDFVCGFWQPLHAEVVEMADSGMSAEEIIDAYVAEHGTEYLMAPPPRGFNLAGYLVPGILITLAAGTLALILRRRVQVATASVAPESAATPGLTDSEHARIAAELEKLDL